MELFYDSKADQARVEKLDQRAQHIAQFGEMCFLVGGGSAGLLIRGLLKDSAISKTVGAIGLATGALGVIWSIHVGKKVSDELKKPENAYLVREGKPLTKQQMNPSKTIKGKLASDDEVVDGRELWEEKTGRKNTLSRRR